MARTSLTEIHFDSILARVSAGERITSILNTPGFPKRAAFEAFLRQHPEYASRYREAKPIGGTDAIAAKFDELMQHVSAGKSLDEALAVFGFSNSSFHKLMRARRDLKAKFVEATEARQAGPNKRGKAATMKASPRWSGADFERALDVIRNCDLTAYDDALGRDVPSGLSVRDRARRDPEYAERLRAAIEARPRPVQYDLDAAIIALRAGRGRSYRRALQRATGQVWPSVVLARLRKHPEFRAALSQLRMIYSRQSQ